MGTTTTKANLISVLTEKTDLTLMETESAVNCLHE